MGIIVLGASYLMPTDIISILVSSYEIPVSCLLIPILFAYFAKHVKRYAGIGAVIGGVAGFIIFHFIISVPFDSLYTLLISLAGFFIGHLLQKTPPQPIPQTTTHTQ